MPETNQRTTSEGSGMTTNDTLEARYKANTFEAQAAYYRWLADNLDPGCYDVQMLTEMATLREGWARTLRAKIEAA